LWERGERVMRPRWRARELGEERVRKRERWRRRRRRKRERRPPSLGGGPKDNSGEALFAVTALLYPLKVALLSLNFKAINARDRVERVWPQCNFC